MNSILGKHISSFSLFLVLSVLAHVLLIITALPEDSLVSTEGFHNPINLSLNQKQNVNSQPVQSEKNIAPEKLINKTNATHFQNTAESNATNKTVATNRTSKLNNTDTIQKRKLETLKNFKALPKLETSNQLEAVNSIEIHHSLRRAITANFAYPPLARRRQWEGLVKISLRIESDGQLSNIHVIKSSGHSVLDRAALYSLKRITSLPHHDDWMNGQHFDTVVPIEYRLVNNQSIENRLRDS